MKFYLSIICIFFLSVLYSQEKVYSYYLYLNDYQNAPKFSKEGDRMIYTGSNTELKNFFAQYKILKFYQPFPEYINHSNILCVHYIETTDVGMITNLKSRFPNLFSKFDDLTDENIEELYYPNDYGITSPVTNLGSNVTRKELDYLNAPEAWNITTGNSNILIGISDGAIDTSADDLNNGKVTVVPGWIGETTSYSHGTGVAALAAARGNNAHGSVGVCMDCNIVAGPISYEYFYSLAAEGAKVINLSWGSEVNDYSQGFSQVRQDVINAVVDEFGVIFVAAAGNRTSYSTPNSFISAQGSPGIPSSLFGRLYYFPASYDNVISVSSIFHKNATMQEAYCCTSPWFPVYGELEDSVGRAIDGTDINNPVGVVRNGYYQDQWNPDGLQYMHTLNEYVDILSTGYGVYWYPSDLIPGHNLYPDGTSSAAPIVSGTIGLMLSVHNCLDLKEVESILKLTTKDIEAMPINQNFQGVVGAGKLEIYDAVKFVDEMVKIGGNAIIDNHIFNRFDFKLDGINNKLTISNIIFKDFCKADFTAKNVIEILPGCDFNPNASGFVDLKLNDQIDITCTVPEGRIANNKKAHVTGQTTSAVTTLYPNPNNGTFEIKPGFFDTSTINIIIYDITGKIVYKDIKESDTLKIDVSNLTAGVYIVRLVSGSHSETIKFIKQ